MARGAAVDARALLEAALRDRTRLHGVMRSAAFPQAAVLRDLFGVWVSELQQGVANQIQVGSPPRGKKKKEKKEERKGKAERVKQVDLEMKKKTKSREHRR